MVVAQIKHTQTLLKHLTRCPTNVYCGHGIGGKVKVWIEDWLSGRKQRVRVNGLSSGWMEVSSGVPQGSVLGPLLFLIFINDIDNGLLNWILKFADDTKIFTEVSCGADLISLQNDVDALCDWANKWQMELT